MTARERRRPGAGAPFPLTPKVEAIVPAVAEPSIPDLPSDRVNDPLVPREARPNSAPAPAPAESKLARTFQLRGSILGGAQTAVLRTGGLEGGYSSLNALVEGAIERELRRLADEFNGGEAFPVHAGKFRAGRPIGS